MKKYTITLMLTLMGMAGCKYNDTTVVDFVPTDEQKIDTALVLGRLHSSSAYGNIHRFMLVNKKGQVVRTSRENEGLTNNSVSNYDFSNVGDTVIVATDKNGDMSIIKNLTMENKIKAFTKQR